MSEDDLNTRILIEIRDAILTTSDRLDQTRTELTERIEHGLAGVRSEISGLRGEIKGVRGAIVEAELRTATREAAHTAATRDL